MVKKILLITVGIIIVAIIIALVQRNVGPGLQTTENAGGQ